MDEKVKGPNLNEERQLCEKQSQITPVSLPTLACYAEIKAWVAAKIILGRTWERTMGITKPRPPSTIARNSLLNRRLLFWLSVSASSNLSGSKIFQLFFEILASKIFCGDTTYRFLLLTVIQTKKCYGTGTRLHNDSLEDPSSTAIPFAKLPKLSRGRWIQRKDL